MSSVSPSPPCISSRVVFFSSFVEHFWSHFSSQTYAKELFLSGKLAHQVLRATVLLYVYFDKRVAAVCHVWEKETCLFPLLFLKKDFCIDFRMETGTSGTWDNR